ncbi:MAG: peptide chain release factor 2 [Anaerolineae bacterium]|nr:peptide chain release factor 2 [Anaerolineae bacterium]MDW8070486.1 peptide chain release factor 2 [Anaerolineae bacterium]
MVHLDIPAKEKEVTRLEAESTAPDFWEDPKVAQAHMRRLATLREEVATWRNLDRRVADALELSVLLSADEEKDEALAAELAAEAAELQKTLKQMEFRLRMSGEHDRDDALLSIHAGAGGTESQDWVAMLLRMYLRWAEDKGYKTEIVDSLEGEEAGLKSVTVLIEGPYAYGYLRSERGVHRLVRLSPFDAAHRRHTSFALVEVMPNLDDDIEVHINPEDIRMDVYKSSGAGGQHVQKNATAVRLVHIPTGIVVTCQNERSQVQNREMAMRILRGRLYELERQKREAEAARLKGEHVEAGWGNQIRSYVLHPYKMVKDHRTNYEVGNAEAVLDGHIDEFIEAYLRHVAV